MIGKRLAEHILSKKGLEIVGAIDVDPNKVGRDLGELLNRGKIGVEVSKDVAEVLSSTKPDIVLHTTSSYIKDTYEQFVGILDQGVSCISTCEELSYPYDTEKGRESAEKLDALARKRKVVLLGTGINPGFLMDAFPITLTGVCTRVDRIYVTRQMNAATRRVPFQTKIGSGLTVQEFKRKIQSHEITGHVGLEQSIKMIADALAWEIDRIKVDPPEPVVLDRDVASEAIKVPKGCNAGTKQKAYGIKGGEVLITLDFRAYIGAPEEFDSIVIEGEPPINQKISPCVHGDYGTIAITANMIPHVLNSEPGFKTMKDLPFPHATTEHMRKYIK